MSLARAGNRAEGSWGALVVLVATFFEDIFSGGGIGGGGVDSYIIK